MPGDEPTVEELKRRQQDVEQAEREALPESQTDADAALHRRRADKARYLREKLEDQQLAEREAAADNPDSG